ncbi:unnamed protein product (macronuclear) [Paramecium tetraurelia]|uniref:MORN repeat protein n=1 Tax=Paramecium tetraurelia TaxID=5888 RepID=A0EH91_PARTE|nr:uncharacterized protein GSPATT00027006001 [Paramecium tetraurelia]CAK94682.1 unnamed protein product [Paramecium tetraurelia]|eukprot:XP_001462055.1 hypothetical protein (macronuclear) [Paramecium tetraurelia strain d4-2]
MNDKNFLISEEKHGLRNIQILYFLIIGMLFFKNEQTMIVNEDNIILFLLQIQQESDEYDFKIDYICKDIKSNAIVDQALYNQPNPLDFNWEKFKTLDEIEYPPLIQYQRLKQQKNQNKYKIQQLIQLNERNEQRLMRDEFYGFLIQDYNDICILKKGLFQNQHFQGEMIEFDKEKNELIHYINIIVDKEGDKLGKNVKICYLSIQVNPIGFKMKRYYRGGFYNNKQNGKGIMIEYDNEGKNRQFYYSGEWENGFLNSFGIFENLNKKANEERLQELKDNGKLEYRKQYWRIRKNIISWIWDWLFNLKIKINIRKVGFHFRITQKKKTLQNKTGFKYKTVFKYHFC